MYLDRHIDDLQHKLSQCPQLQDASVIKAYPYAIKPTALDSIVITLSPGGVNCDNVELGGNVMYGRYDIDAHFFVPHKMGSPVATDIVSRFLRNCVDNSVQGIRLTQIDCDDLLRCYTAKCTLTYYDRLEFGDDSDER